jgi:glycerate 2-kinase
LMSREQARMIWDAAVDAVRPANLLRPGLLPLDNARRIIVMGAGKAGATMSVALESLLSDRLDGVVGWVNVPAGTELPTQRIYLHPARPAGSNHPTEEGVAGSREILRLAREAGPDDIGVCLWSGGGSALLPAPAHGITLADKQSVTKLLHSCGATINQMNAVRKHLSAIKGGRLAEAFAGKALVSLCLSDVVGDPLDVIASGPTAPDPTTWVDVEQILNDRFRLTDKMPPTVKRLLERGLAGDIPETPKTLPGHVVNRIIGNNALALTAAERTAGRFGYQVLNLGSMIEGETREAATVFAGIIKSVVRDRRPFAAPVCLLSGGETTVTLSEKHGRGGRNQEFVLALLDKLGGDGMRDIVVLSGGTDGEDGPTDAAGALGDAGTWSRSAKKALTLAEFLSNHDAYSFFEATGDLVRSGPTGTNVMDVRVILIGKASTP